MLLRPRQALFVQRSIAALLKYGNTLAIAPTGAGKTIIFSTVIGRMLREYAGKACILAHRDELIRQNNDKFSRINPRISTSIVNAEAKSWAGRAIFAMVPTLARQANLDGMPKLDILVIDEAHHAAAASYQRIIDVVRDINPNCLIYGLTATPARGDKKALRSIFTNVADHINLDELIQSGHLVPPRTFVIDVGTQKALRSVRRTAADFDMDAVSRIMNQTPVTEAVIDHWKQKAGDRKTVVFCATVNHAKSVTAAFNAALVNAVLVHGDLADSERRAAIDKFEKGGAQVVVNVMVLTEGWDYQPIDCVVLLRPSSY